MGFLALSFLTKFTYGKKNFFEEHQVKKALEKNIHVRNRGKSDYESATFENK